MVDKSRNESRGPGLALLKKVIEKPDASLSAQIGDLAMKRYSVPAKSLQIESVLNLARRRNVILLAGTGFGKSRIPEIFHDLIPKRSKGVILVLNPLDALGNNQVLEKKKAGFTAINLTKLTFNPAEAANVQKGEYNFVYLSPEIYLNSKLFSAVYFSREFQGRLGLVVVDEAHLIYHWGMVKSVRGSKKRSSALGRHEDRGIFRPSYGRLGTHLMARNGAPILLLSATCPPKPLNAIQKNLKLDGANLVILRGELTRPEIRIIRVTMKGSMASMSDLADLYAPLTVLPNEKVVPTLIYSGSRRRTGHVLEVLAKARGTPDAISNARSPFARRYHSCTGELDKTDVENDFGEGRFPLISCTMALGLGQNWTRVRSVIHLGRGDPSAICQMIGRCGRDGKPGLAIMFVEKTRLNGKNSPSQFMAGRDQSDDDRMDALAITPVCLRIAFSIDNLYGYIPMSTNDEGYLVEKAREVKENFPDCRCSNCLPAQAGLLMDCMPSLNIDNLDDMIMKDIDQHNPLIHKSCPMPRPRITSTPMTPADTVLLAGKLMEAASQCISAKLGQHSFLTPEDIFSKDEIDSIIKRIMDISSEEDVRVAIGGHWIDGLVSCLHEIIMNFKSGPIYKAHVSRIESDQEDKYVKKTAYKYLNDNQKKRKAELKQIDAANKKKKSDTGVSDALSTPL